MRYVHKSFKPVFEKRLREYMSCTNPVEAPLSFSVWENAWIDSQETWKEGKLTSKPGVYDCGGSYAPLSDIHELLRDDYKLDFQSREFVCRDETVIFIGQLISIWGHLLSDDIKKLWFLFSTDGKAMLEAGARIVYVTNDGLDCPDYFRRFLSLAGVDFLSFERINELTRFSKIVIPDNALVNGPYGRVANTVYIELIRKIRLNALCRDSDMSCNGWEGDAISKDARGECVLPNKIYLSRKYCGNRDYNEIAVESFFKMMGYTVISPEKYPIEQQIKFLSNAEDVAVTEGSISHSIMFCPPTTRIQLLMKSDFVNGYQICINRIFNLKVEYITAHRTIIFDKTAPWTGPFFLSITPQLLRWAKENQNRKTGIKILLAFFKSSLAVYIDIAKFLSQFALSSFLHFEHIILTVSSNPESGRLESGE